jgi:hypothetical protein
MPCAASPKAPLNSNVRCTAEMQAGVSRGRSVARYVALVPAHMSSRLSLPSVSRAPAVLSRSQVGVAQRSRGRACAPCLGVAAATLAGGVGCPSFGGQRPVLASRRRRAWSSSGSLGSRRTGLVVTGGANSARDAFGGATGWLFSRAPNPSLKRTSLSWLRQPKAAA